MRLSIKICHIEVPELISIHVLFFYVAYLKPRSQLQKEIGSACEETGHRFTVGHCLG